MSEKEGTKSPPDTTPPTAWAPAARRPVEPSAGSTACAALGAKASSVPSASDATGNGRPEGLLAEASAGLRPIVTAVGGTARAVRSTGLEACSASVLAASSSRQDATVARRGMVCAVGAERPQIPNVTVPGREVKRGLNALYFPKS